MSQSQNFLEEKTSFGEASGVEDEQIDRDEDISVIGEPFNPDKIDVATRSMTIDLLLSRIKSNAIDLEPDFQRRRGIWTDRQQSRLIESLLLKIPLPTLYAAEDEEENWVIVDGIQRLTTITRFMDPDIISETRLILGGLEYLGSAFNGKSFQGLSSRFQRRLRETELVVHLIKHGTPEEVKFNIFARINTGGLPLSSQELRHALIPGRARSFLADLAGTVEFKAATSNSIRDERMADREMVLRFIAFKLNPPQQYKAYDFDRFLGDTMREINGKSEDFLNSLKRDFRSALRAALKIFEQDAFRKRYRVSDARYPVNKALFETFVVNLANIGSSRRQGCIDNKDLVKNEFMLLMNTREFESSISQGTGDIAKVRRRFGEVEALLVRCSND
ncbi:DUF262 domain-containing protein [Methylobacterium sp. Leaf88]|uniref:DUF262 domain-containing protein n=1 Tax=Methylobacterium sp. Leaf88 TaxID=1736244 RepID=UPI0009EA2FD8|nr:DUF262 domain-containing protein [Methylobacterium sp. Leaf88]